ncbi:MAG: rod shape-determining protein RodA [Deltaproteobacteria bacterium]|nr:rod shape-determining protein RodA [Deltaproteobacteria bacterium]
MKKLDNIHWPLFGVLMILVGVGLINLYSALHSWGDAPELSLFWHQVGIFLVSVIPCLLLVVIDYRIWERFWMPFYLLSIFFLVIVLLFGREVSGHRSWLSFGFFSFQPSEFAKLALLFVLAKTFSDRPNVWGLSLRYLLKPLFLTLIPFALVLGQKDLGSSLFFPLIFITVALMAKVERKTLLLFLCLLVAGGAAAYRYGLKPYQKERIRIFLHPEADPQKSGYHLIQAKIAIGSGQIVGKGFLRGRINKLKYVPDKHTDFIFSVLAEEWGLIGSGFLLTLYGILLWSGMKIAIRARDTFGTYLACGITGLFFWHIVINIGGVLGMMPLTGVPLPLMSYGGTASIVFLLGGSLLMNIHRQRFMF